MTRAYFEDCVLDFDDLIDFCYQEDCDICEDIYTQDGVDEDYNNQMVTMAQSARDWRELLDDLRSIPTDYEYYHWNGSEYEGLDEDDFSDYKYDVMEWGDEMEVWDDEEEIEAQTDYDEEPLRVKAYAGDEDAPEEELSISELFC